MRRRSARVATQCAPLALVLLALMPLAAWAASGGFMPMITDSSLVFSIPAVPKPAYLVPVTDPVFGTTVTRIAGDAGASFTTSTGGNGTWGSDARHHYSKDQPWNSDGTLIAIQNNGSPSQVILDGETYQVKYGKCSNYSLGDERWHPSPLHPHEQINVHGSELMWFDVVECVKTRTWSLPFSVNYFGMGEGNPSADGRFVALSDGTRMFVVDMDPQSPFPPYPSQRIGPTYTIPPCGLSSCSIDWVSISASGKYVVVNYDGDHPRVFDVDPNTLAISPRPMPTSAPRCSGGDPAQGFIYDVGHADLTLNPFDNNEDVLVGQEHCGNRGHQVQGQLMGGVAMVRLRDGTVTSLTDPTNEAYPHHISARSYDRPGWVYVGYYPQAGKRFADEIVAVKMDGSQSVQRFAHKHSAFSGCYRCESHAVPSRDGRRVIWTSNWAEDCTTCGSSSEVKDYVVDARAPASADTIPPNPRADLRTR